MCCGVQACVSVRAGESVGTRGLIVKRCIGNTMSSMQHINMFLYLLYCLLCLQVSQAQDLQEYLSNRNIRTTFNVPVYLFTTVSDGTFTAPKYLGGPTTGLNYCVYDSDCQVRLGTPATKPQQLPQTLASNGFPMCTPTADSTASVFLNQPFNYPYATVATIIFPISELSTAIDFIAHECPPNATLSQGLQCQGFNLDPNSGIECNLDGANTNNAYGGNQCGNDDTTILHQTFVKYPDLRCIEGQCLHWDQLNPGFGVSYCTPQFRAGGAANLGTCAGAQTCVVPIDTGYVTIDPWMPFCQNSNAVIQQRTDTGLGRLPHSTDPRDTVGTCGCANDTQCATGMICLNSRCYCTSSSQCGDSNVCLTNSAVLATNTDSTSTTIFGSCGCEIGSETACSYKGICTAMETILTNTNIPAYFTVEDFNSVPRETSSGRCVCYGKVPAWQGDAAGNYNDTIVGQFCEADSYRELVCAGHGNPICTGFQLQEKGITTGVAILSLNDGSLLGYECPAVLFDTRGQNGVCQCDLGWGPDTPTGAFGVITPCSIPPSCLASAHSQIVDGVCECTQPDTYLSVTATSDLCVKGCSQNKAKGNGICGYNSLYVEGFDTTTKYNNDVFCFTGWATMYNQPTPVPGNLEPYIAASFGIPLNSTIGSRNQNAGWQRIYDNLNSNPTRSSQYCTVPFNTYTGSPCGFGSFCAECSWAVFQGYTQLNGAPIGPVCSCVQTTTCEGVQSFGGNTCLDNGNNQIQVISYQSPAPYCATVCLPLTKSLANLTTPHAYNNQTCGGPLRGSCISCTSLTAPCTTDTLGGQMCACNNGYSGVVCQNRLCPIARGLICGSSGTCDASTGKCLCNTGFYGLACEFGSSDCANSQVVRSYPLPLDLPDY